MSITEEGVDHPLAVGRGEGWEVEGFEASVDAKDGRSILGEMEVARASFYGFDEEMIDCDHSPCTLQVCGISSPNALPF